MKLSGRGLGGSCLPVRLGTFVACLTIGLLIGFAPSAPLASGAASPVSAATGDSDVVGAGLQDQPGQTESFWTRQRLLAARPAETPTPPEAAFDIPSPGSAQTSNPGISAADGDFFPTGIQNYPLRVHGMIFFLVGEQAFSCSGTVVDSKGGNVVFTAGHCVYDRDSSAYVDQLIFIPAYKDGNSPLGIWPATAVFTTSRFAQEGRLSHDVGAVVLENRIQNDLGARKIAFNLDPKDRSFRIFGYPVKPDPPFDGESLAGCRSSAVGRDSGPGKPFPIAAGPCTMGQGSSGGGWITGGGYLNSVVSYSYCDEAPDTCGLTFGPYFKTQALDLYTFPAIGGSAAPTVGLASAPVRRSRRGRISLRFRFTGSGSTPVGFRCKLDGGSPFKCGARTTLRGLSGGRHVLRVHSVDQTGRISPGAVKKTFRVARSSR